ncbi:hypothetical protein ACQP1W_21985 [Spirillospora sp. CA-255316]
MDDFAESFDADGVCVVVAAFEEDRVQVAYVGVDGDEVVGEVGIDDPAVAVVGGGAARASRPLKPQSAMSGPAAAAAAMTVMAVSGLSAAGRKRDPTGESAHYSSDLAWHRCQADSLAALSPFPACSANQRTLSGFCDQLRLPLFGNRAHKVVAHDYS